MNLRHVRPDDFLGVERHSESRFLLGRAAASGSGLPSRRAGPGFLAWCDPQEGSSSGGPNCVRSDCKRTGSDHDFRSAKSRRLEWLFFGRVSSGQLCPISPGRHGDADAATGLCEADVRDAIRRGERRDRSRPDEIVELLAAKSMNTVAGVRDQALVIPALALAVGGFGCGNPS